MKSENLTIYGYFGKDKSILKARKVRAYPAFEKFGFKFLAHRGVTPKSKRFWFVSESTSGTSVIQRCGILTMRAAIRDAEIITDTKGESNTIIYVANSITYVKRHLK